MPSALTCSALLLMLVLALFLHLISYFQNYITDFSGPKVPLFSFFFPSTSLYLNLESVRLIAILLYFSST